MAGCSGNDTIISVSLDKGLVTVARGHEKDENCGWISEINEYGTACVVTRDFQLLRFGYLGQMVDDDCTILIPCIVDEFYQICGEKERDQNDVLILKVFAMYIHTILQEMASKYNIELHKTVHYAVIVPDAWDYDYFNIIKQQLALSQMIPEDQLSVIRQAYALMRRLQSPQYDFSFKSDGVYIVCSFEDDGSVVMYVYQFGGLVKGLNNIMRYALKTKKDFGCLEEHYFVHTLFNGSSEEVKEYRLDLQNLEQCYYHELSNNTKLSLYEVIIQYRNRYFRNMSDTLLDDKEHILKSIQLQDIQDSMSSLFDGYSKAIQDQITQVIKMYPDNKVMFIYTENVMNNKRQSEFMAHLIRTFMTPYKPLLDYTKELWVEGAVQVIQDQLGITNYIPQIINRESVSNITSENTLHIDVNWNSSSVLYVNAYNKKTYIKCVSTDIKECYALHECIDVYKNDFRSAHISITEKLAKSMTASIRPTDLSPEDPLTRFCRNRICQYIDSVSHSMDQKPSKPLELTEDIDIPLFAQYIHQIPRNDQKELLMLYIELLQARVVHHIISRQIMKETDTFKCYISIEQRTLDLFSLNPEQLRNALVEITSLNYPIQPMKLIHREQVSAVYCKDLLQCYNRVNDYLDYPQYIVQAQINETYISLALSVILPLEKDIKTSKNETVLVLKRTTIPVNIMDSLSERLLEFIQSMDGFQIEACKEHASDYDDVICMEEEFKEQFKQYFTHEFTINNEQGQIEWYEPIRIKMNSLCDCAFTTTPIDLFDICITPVIKQLTSKIYASVLDPGLFGEYKMHHLLIMGKLFDIKGCSNAYNQVMDIMKKMVLNQQKHQVHWIDEDVSTVVRKGMESIIDNPIGGLLEQVYAGSYLLKGNRVLRTGSQGSDVIKEDTYYPFIKEGTRITEEMRMNGVSFQYHVDNASDLELEIGYRANGQDTVNGLVYTGDYIGPSWPLVIEYTPGIYRSTMSISGKKNGALVHWGRYMKSFNIKETIMLSVY
ncbi:hypothetical protein BDB01DRAFT_804860 [Pilobolus umbonatus]|nr:hypothetical protein BDB01DRAFT_804860 [Pilobolus umbonatus]